MRLSEISDGGGPPRRVREDSILRFLEHLPDRLPKLVDEEGNSNPVNLKEFVTLEAWKVNLILEIPEWLEDA